LNRRVFGKIIHKRKEGVKMSENINVNLEHSLVDKTVLMIVKDSPLS